MLHKKVRLVGLQVCCPTEKTELNKIAGQIRNLFYAASLPWCEGNLGRVITMDTVDDFLVEYHTLRNDLLRPKADGVSATLTLVPFPTGEGHVLREAPEFVSAELEFRFRRRLNMLRNAIEEEKRFYASLLSELEKVIKMGLFLKKNISPDLSDRMKAAQKVILCFSADDVRRSTSVREDILATSGALL